VKAFTKSIALKWNLEPTKIAGLVRILPEGLEVEVHGHVIRELADGQDMTMEVLERKCRSQLRVKRKCELSIGVSVQSEGCELKLLFQFSLFHDIAIL